MILNFKDVYFLLNNLLNVINLVLLNNGRIFHNSKNKIFYDANIKEKLTYAKRWNNSFFIQPFKISNMAAYLTKK